MAGYDYHTLLKDRASLLARIRLIPYDGSPEVKEISGEKYLYVRKRVLGKNTSTYVGPYTEELLALLVRQNRELRALKKELRQLGRRLAEAGYTETELSPRVLLNADLARSSLKGLIYDQAVLEGVTATFPQTETILENGVVQGVTAADVRKILNLKHAWEFILDPDVLAGPSDLPLLSYLAGLVNEGFYAYGGALRTVPVRIGGSSFLPPLPVEADVKDRLREIVNAPGSEIDRAVSLALYCMRMQIFNDGNKRTAVLFANHFLIARGGGLLVVPESSVPAFRTLLIGFYESGRDAEIRDFLRQECWKKL